MITYIASTEYIQNTTKTVAIFHHAIIASVASINHKNIVPESHIRIFSFTSNHQKGIIIHTRIIDIHIINSAFFNNSSVLSLLNKIIQSRNNIKNEIIDNHEVFHCIQSVQFNVLKINTYHSIVKNNGIK
jgi:hypothetical protein